MKTFIIHHNKGGFELLFQFCIHFEVWIEWIIEWGFRPPVCTYRLNWVRRTSWGWWDECDDTALQTQDSKFEPWRSEIEYATSRSQILPTILNLNEWVGKKDFVYLKLECQSGARARNLRLSKQRALTTAPGHRSMWITTVIIQMRMTTW